MKPQIIDFKEVLNGGYNSNLWTLLVLSLFLWHMVEILAIINRVLRTSQQMVETFMSDSLFSYQQMRTQLTTESPMTRRKNKPEDDATTR